MNETTTKMRPTLDGLTHGTCRIRWWPHSLAECLETDEAVILELRPERGKWADYWVSSVRDVDGSLLGYRLEKMVGHPEEAAPTYTLCVEGDTLVCDCPDATRRRHACKHSRALTRCLKIHGLWQLRETARAVAAVVLPALAPLEDL